MRNTLLLKWMLALACALPGLSCADAAERIIRPRRVNRGVNRTAVAAFSAHAVESPVAEDGTGQAPLKTLTPPDGTLLKSGLMRPANLMREFGEEHADNSTKDYQEKRENPPEEALKNDSGKTSGDTGKLVDSLPPYVSYDNYQEMNRQRQDFHPPMETAQPEENPKPAPGTAIPPKYKKQAEEPQEKPEEEPVHGTSAPQAAPAPASAPENTTIPPAPPLLYADGTAEPEPATATVSAPPTPAEVESYRRRLEFRLLERYNNLPEHAGGVGKVSVVLSKPLQPSLDGTRLRAEFDQLVYDPWGKRIPSLEKEYYVVTFSAGGVRQVRSDPSVRVGLNHERTYSEPAPEAEIAEKIRTLPPDHAFRAHPSAEVPSIKMPDWWRPEFADDGY